ncbi:XTP/dITP diphosphatase [Paenibacillus sp. 1001270B_150601_E10]|uniref:XTP/dITP diphosphatase n=1 Tax=Paenibacillus sp. 1001270B_150601_E10 TaxID=2787079 RepID=UPI00189FDD1E|nr:XTP/dITP diphosphatase [Paenibacillus sp. 1001270B_150601_E10]
MPIKGDTVFVATRNAGKLREFSLAFSSLGLKVKSLADFPDIPDVVEDGETFLENAMKKAKTVAEALQVPVLADDSGLCVGRLDGEPGVYSARYAGEHGNDQANNEKLLRELKKLPAWDTSGDSKSERIQEHWLSPAQFVCSLVLYDPANKKAYEAMGTVDGYITDHPRGEYGFGYDPLFYVPAYDCTMAQLSPEEKQRISHRGRALDALLTRLSSSFSE